MALDKAIAYTNTSEYNENIQKVSEESSNIYTYDNFVNELDKVYNN